MLLLALFILLSILQPLAFKVTSVRLNKQTGPIFLSVWTFFGLFCTWNIFGNLLVQEMVRVIHTPYLVILLLCKGSLLWLLFHDSLSLAEKSLSAHSYYLPTALGAIAIGNSFLGEHLNWWEWIAAIGLCFAGILFSLRGHLQELSLKEKLLYFKLVLLSIATGLLDQAILIQTNWYVLLSITNFILLIFCAVRTRDFQIWKSALSHKMAIITGIVFTSRELLKFYMMVSILPMSVVLSAQVAVIPVVLVLSALIWNERSWKEQTVWGLVSLSFLFILIIGRH